jgi:hypothetical protein
VRWRSLWADEPNISKIKSVEEYLQLMETEDGPAQTAIDAGVVNDRGHAEEGGLGMAGNAAAAASLQPRYARKQFN